MPRRELSTTFRLAALGLLLTLLGPTLHALTLPYWDALFPAASHCSLKSKKCCCHRSAKAEKEPHLHAPEGMPCGGGCCGASCCASSDSTLAAEAPVERSVGQAPAMAPWRARPPTAGPVRIAPREFALFSRPPPAC